MITKLLGISRILVMKKSKFTLIELLVVIAIIGILASLLLPALGKARKQSQMAVCKSNMKQIHVALQLYFDDNDDYFPLDTANLSWDDYLNGYDGRNVANTHYNTNNPIPADQYGSTSLYTCPSDDITRYNNNVIPLSYSPTQFINHNSGINGVERGLTGFHNNTGELLSVKTSDIQDSSYTLSTIEFMHIDRALGRNWMSVVRIGSNFLNSPANHPHQSLNKLNFLFVDT